MKNTTLIIITLVLNISFSQNDNLRNRYGNDILSENPINPIPKEMTFDEYQDMNRRLNVGLLLAAIPIPGTIHHYAGEQKIAKKIRWVAAGSILAIIGGAISMKEDGWKESPYQISIVNEGNDNEIKYEQLKSIIQSLNFNILKDISIFDKYEGEHIDAGKKSYAIRLRFQDEERTLEDKQIEKLISKIIIGT